MKKFHQFLCSNCEREISAPPEAIGQKTRCCLCDAVIVVPTADQDRQFRDDVPRRKEAARVQRESEEAEKRAQREQENEARRRQREEEKEARRRKEHDEYWKKQEEEIAAKEKEREYNARIVAESQKLSATSRVSDSEFQGVPHGMKSSASWRIIAIVTAGIIAIVAVAVYQSFAESRKKALEAEHERLAWRIYEATANEVKESTRETESEIDLMKAGMSSDAARAWVANLYKDDHEDARLGVRRAEDEMRQFLRDHPEMREGSSYKDL